MQYWLTEPRLNQLWVADVTYVPTVQGWLYLACVTDVFRRMVLGWSMASHRKTDLVVDAVTMAVSRRGGHVPGVIHHSDRGGEGGINRSSQHPVMMEVFDGSSTTDFGSCRAASDEIAWSSVSAQASGAGVLAADRRGIGQRGRRGRCRRVRAGRIAVVPPRWRDTTDHSRRAFGPVPVVR